jgi:predicted esterase
MGSRLRIPPLTGNVACLPNRRGLLGRPLARFGILALATGGSVFSLAGCAVPQPRGEGKLDHIVEPTTKRGYWLYLPKEYVALDEAGRAARRWPLVVTFHGMKPYDVSYSQAREWEQEADRYGFVVVAPELTAFVFIFGEFPLRTLNPAIKSDEQTTLATMDHVFETTHADPNNVLATSWSSGGYMAHYMLNRHPERFTCLAVRQSNFSANVLDSAATSRSLYHPVLILSTQNDFEICKRESREAIQWYENHAYKNFAWVYINKLGHERTPDTAADFFARACGARPNRPPDVLFQRQAIDGNPKGLALLAGNLGSMQRAPGAPPSDTRVVAQASQAPAPRPPTPRRPALVAATPTAAPPTTPTPARAPDVSVARLTPEPTPPPPAPPPGKATPLRTTASVSPAGALTPLGIRVSSAIGFEPLLLVYSVECPAEWHRTADFYWTLDNNRIGGGVNGQRTIGEPGDYTLEVLVVTQDGAEHRASRRVRVLKNVESAAAPAHTFSN